MFAACDGEYILIGAGEMVDGDFADFDGSGDDSASSNGLADTGFDSSALAGFAAALVSLGTVSVLRRRRRS
jgi:LPXTG-motif cell wall-anchored protein